MPTLQKITQDELDERLGLHALWRASTAPAGSPHRLNRPHSDFRGLDFNHSELSLATLHHSDFRGATGLRDTHIRLVNLRCANLSGLDLTGVALNYSDLAGACLVGTNLTGATLFNCAFVGADLTGARGLATTDLAAAHLNKTAFATLPDEIQLELMARWALRGGGP